ncbi:MAG: helix-turn-helix domain-containing protein [Chloroflexi bacterium]|nr:helix-turn-helix domain-containing protein [Chloroflexota bacterium]
MIENKLLNADQLANILNISRSKAYQLMRNSEIPTITIGRNVRVSHKDLEEFIEQNRSNNGGNDEQQGS